VLLNRTAVQIISLFSVFFVLRRSDVTMLCRRNRSRSTCFATLVGVGSSTAWPFDGYFILSDLGDIVRVSHVR
jgi:hypothetical protein